tara:strand:+ start:7851 stop:8873 length:1023 start_codon:yes stop_codon:yes gene_type:complete
MMKVACIGAGYFARFHHDGWSRMAGVEFAAICDADIAKAEASAREFGASRTFADIGRLIAEIQPDLIDIATPPPTHLPIIRACIDHNIPVICQKPFCGGLEGATEAVRLSEASGVPVIVHENFRFQPWFAEAGRQLAKGAVGNPYQVTFRLRPGDGRGPEAYLDRQPYFQQMERFLVHETAVHIIDVFRFLMGPVTAVTAQLARLNPAISGEDAGFILFEFASGARGLFDGNRLSSHASENRRRTMGEMWLEGSEAVLQLDGDGGLSLRPHDSNSSVTISYDWEDTGFAGDCVYKLQRHIIDTLTAGTAPANTARDYLTNLRLVEAVYQSSAEGRRIEIS